MSFHLWVRPQREQSSSLLRLGTILPVERNGKLGRASNNEFSADDDGAQQRYLRCDEASEHHSGCGVPLAKQRRMIERVRAHSDGNGPPSFNSGLLHSESLRKYSPHPEAVTPYVLS